MNPLIIHFSPDGMKIHDQDDGKYPRPFPFNHFKNKNWPLYTAMFGEFAGVIPEFPDRGGATFGWLNP